MNGKSNFALNAHKKITSHHIKVNLGKVKFKHKLREHYINAESMTVGNLNPNDFQPPPPHRLQ